MEIKSYEWYLASEILPEDSSLPKDNHGILGWFLIALQNGDMYCANRWNNSSTIKGRWYWDTDSDYNDAFIERRGITHWMLVEPPK